MVTVVVSDDELRGAGFWSISDISVDGLTLRFDGDLLKIADKKPHLLQLWVALPEDVESPLP